MNTISTNHYVLCFRGKWLAALNRAGGGILGLNTGQEGTDFPTV
jgi:hypothetical protein